MATIKTFNAIDRIGEIAQGFQQGGDNFAKYTQQGNATLANALQIEAQRRQQALEAEKALTEATGQNFIGSGVGAEFVKTGSMPSIGQLFNSTQATPKAQKAKRDQERQDLQDKKLKLDIEEQEKPFEETKEYKKAKALAGLKKENQLPLENKTVVQTLAKKNADAEYIANQIESFLEKAKNYSPDQVYTQGNQLIKTLNSTISSDAAGAEEVQRLAGKLKFAFGNFTNDNPTQFGRDLEGFVQQARDTAAIMRGGIAKNVEMINQQYGGRGMPQGGSRTPSAPGGAGEGPWSKYGKRP